MNERARDLVDRYVEGELDDAGRAELAELAAAEPDIAGEIFRTAEERVMLVELFGREAATAGDRAPLRVRRRTTGAPATARIVPWAAALAGAAAAVVLGVFVARNDSPGPREARALRVDGAATHVWPAGGATHLAAGDAFGPGHRVEVAPDSSATFLFGDGTTIDVLGDSALSMAAATAAKRFDLARGALRAYVAPQAPDAPLCVRTRHATATVRGTRFAIAVAGEGTRLEVAAGRVEFRRLSDGASVEVAARQCAVAAGDVDLVALPLGGTPAPAGLRVAPDGRDDGAGTAADPVSLAGACARDLRPGTTVLLAGGLYRTAPGAVPVVRWKGTPAARITMRPVPGARAVIDGRLDVDGAAHVTLRGLEMTRGDDAHATIPDWRDVPPRERPSNLGEGFATGGSLLNVIAGQGVDLARLYLHDNVSGGGIDVQWRGFDTTVRGCIVARCGWDDAGRGHGFGINVRNNPRAGAQPAVAVRDTICAFDRSIGLRAQGEQPDIVSIEFARTIVYASGMTSWTRGAPNLIVGTTEGRVDDIVVRDSHFWQPDGCAGHHGGKVYLGYGGRRNGRLEFTGNHVWGGGDSALRLKWWEQATVTGNTVYDDAQLVAVDAPEAAARQWRVDGNRYFAGAIDAPFALGDERLTWAQWRARAGFDVDSTCVPERPARAAAVVIPVEGEPGVAHVAVYNPARAASVAVDLAPVLARGRRFTVRDAADYLARPVAAGTWEGTPVRVPVAADEVTRGEFAAFVVETEE